MMVDFLGRDVHFPGLSDVNFLGQPPVPQVLSEGYDFLGDWVGAIQLILGSRARELMILPAPVVGSAYKPPVEFVFPRVRAVRALEGGFRVHFRNPGLRPRASSENVPK
eukprot:9014643-Heterocapsa_arctica.AAC.1